MTARAAAAALVTLLCRHCGQAFKTPEIVAVCPLCARSDHPIEIGGELSGNMTAPPMANRPLSTQLRFGDETETEASSRG